MMLGPMSIWDDVTTPTTAPSRKAGRRAKCACGAVVWGGGRWPKCIACRESEIVAKKQLVSRLCIECDEPVKGQAKRCPECRDVRDKEVRAAAMRAYRLRHPDKIREQRREGFKRYRKTENGRKVRNASRKRWRARNKDRLKKKRQEYYYNGSGREVAARWSKRYFARKIASDPDFMKRRQTKAKARRAKLKADFMKNNPFWEYGKKPGYWLKEHRKQRALSRGKR